MSDYVLELRDVTKRYDGFTLDHVSFCVPRGCICGFIGQNGAGKTTTIQLILDIVKRDEGSIRVFGEDMPKNGALWKERIGVVFDEMGFHEFLTATQINRVMKQVYANWQEEIFFDYLERFSLPRKKRCGSFSRGMRMKLQIAVALSHKAEFLILDEPTSGLDPLMQKEFFRLLRQRQQEGATVFFSSHVLSEVQHNCTRAAIIREGSIVAEGSIMNFPEPVQRELFFTA